MRNAVASTTFGLLLLFSPSLAFSLSGASHDEEVLDASGLAQLETRAEHANPREQAFLYTELVHVYTGVAGRQLAAGEIDQAGVTLKRVQRFADHIHMGLAKDTKRLKNAEILMHSATYKLGQYMHLVSSEDKAVVESTLKQLEKVNEELLTQVFAH